MEYYYTPKQYISTSSLTIVDDEAKHLSRVLRKKQGEEIYVTDGEGNLYKTLIQQANKVIIECSIIEKTFGLNEPEIKINLYQSLIKNPDRFEFAVEKATELGVHSIYPIITENTINKTTNKTERWQAIALSAMKQSQRCVLPKVFEPVEFSDAVKNSGSSLKLIADEKISEGRIRIDNAEINSDTIDIFIGPEGGFTIDEVNLSVSSGFKVISLGARKYRSETAAIIAIANLIR
ncbi:MAG: 16S rRNA (uracil(1498)-N(3))-methyltransferase [Ignavibacteria bacterium]|nr:16S rRNA (uracil(1498)-N(3))-methyltransferase [Ignavibacteria bacterium]